MRFLDSHLHLWDPKVLAYEWLNGRLLRPFGAEELADAVRGVDESDFGFIFVQAETVPEQSLAEVDWVSSLSDQIDVRRIVARAPLEDPTATDDLLEHFASRPLVAGVRRLLQSEGDGFTAAAGFRQSAQALARAGYTFDACVRRAQLVEVAALADAVPDPTIVLDHLGNPDVADPGAAADGSKWAADLRALAERTNVACKLSGLPATLAGGWSAERLHPFLDAALEAFGSDRLLFGSDWPVSVPYRRWIQTIESWLADRVDDAQAAAVFAGNAERVYRLG